jgi:hypothetical protein
VITAAGPSNASIVGVTDVSGDTWAVTVNTGIFPGEIRLDLVDDDSIKNVSFHRLGGDGAGNGSFTAGEIYTIIGYNFFLPYIATNP